MKEARKTLRAQPEDMGDNLESIEFDAQLLHYKLRPELVHIRVATNAAQTST